MAPPRIGPYFWIARIVYLEQLGVNLQEGGKSGDTNLWYPLMIHMNNRPITPALSTPTSILPPPAGEEDPTIQPTGEIRSYHHPT